MLRLRTLGMALAAIGGAAGAALAQPVTMVYQGYLTDSGGDAVDGDVTLTFTLYDALTGGASLWAEAVDATVEAGAFSVVLGAGNPLDEGLFPPDEDRWLGVEVEDGGELSPRQPLGSVPWAFTCGDAQSVGGARVTELQPLVTGACTPGSSIRAINPDGTVECETDDTGAGGGGDITGVTAGSGLSGGGLTGDVTLSIGDGAVTSGMIAPDTVAAVDIATGAVTTTEILDGTVMSTDIADGAVGSADIADSSIASADIAADTIAAADIATGAVTTSEILDGTITAADFAAGALPAGDSDYIQNQTAAAQSSANYWISGNGRMGGLARIGSETGSASTPSTLAGYAGTLVRRINETSTAVGTDVARTDDLILERDGSYGGMQINYTTAGGTRTVACRWVTSTGASGSSYAAISSAGVTSLWSDAAGVVWATCSFGYPFGLGHQTTVDIARQSTDYYWQGHVVSTYNQ